jgi:electron transfer flavoprotein beta subunit
VRLDGSGVLSVEGSTARLRRAALGAVMSSGRAPIEVVTPAPAVREASGVADTHLLRPFRPRARVLPGPVGTTALDRVRALTDSTAASSHGHEVVVLDPPAAADRILDALAAWGYRER